MRRNHDHDHDPDPDHNPDHRHERFDERGRRDEPPGRPGRGHRPPPPPGPPRGRGGPWGRFAEFGPDGPPPWVARRMRRGDIRPAVLRALGDGPGHGYELMQRLAERSGGRWKPSPGSIYPTLQALQDEGLVSSTEADGKRVYELTDAGRAVAAEHAEGAPWSDGPDDPRVALWKSVGQLAAAAKQVGMHGSPELLTRAEEVLTDARRKLYQLLAES